MVLVGLSGERFSGKKTVVKHLIERSYMTIDLRWLLLKLLKFEDADVDKFISHFVFNLNQHNSISAYWDEHCNNYCAYQESVVKFQPLDRDSMFKRLDYITQKSIDAVRKRWTENFVLSPIVTKSQLALLRKVPFSISVYVDTPMLTRLKRDFIQADLMTTTRTHWEACDNIDRESLFFGLLHGLEKFNEQDEHMFIDTELGTRYYNILKINKADRIRLGDCDFTLNNEDDKKTLESQIHALSERVDDVVRPSWDTYFMRLAFMASSRSNCMRRRVGAIVVKNRRVIGTGYNGTPSHIMNCNEGGCKRCNNPDHDEGSSLDACQCLHAEMNAVLEADRDRCKGSEMYVTTMPCLTCAKIIIQAGVIRVMYATSYKCDNANTFLLSAGITLQSYADSLGNKSAPLESIRQFLPMYIDK